MNEEVVIDGNIIVTVVEIRGDKVRLGFRAPPEVIIHRREVQDAVDRENRAGGAPGDDDWRPAS